MALALCYVDRKLLLVSQPFFQNSHGLSMTFFVYSKWLNRVAEVCKLVFLEEASDGVSEMALAETAPKHLSNFEPSSI